MTQDEARKVLAIIKAAYPASYKNLKEQEAWGIVSIWASQFARDSAELVLFAVQKCIASSEFPPTISEVKSKMRGIYWEAWEACLFHENGCKTMSDAEYATMKKLEKELERYHNAGSNEPTLAELMSGWKDFAAGGENGGKVDSPRQTARLKQSN